MLWLASNVVTKSRLIKTLRVDFLQVMQYFFCKKWPTWPVERAESFDIQNRYKRQLRIRWDSPFNPRPAGPLDFPRPAGGGVFEHPPPSISAPAHRRTKRKTAFESSRKIISKSFRSFFGSGQNWGHQGSKFQNFPKRFLDDKIFTFKGRATILIPSCLSRQGASNHV